MRTRLNKSEEYARKFEETTKQEIKTYRDSLLNTHASLEEFRLKLKEASEHNAKQVAHLSSEIKKLEIQNYSLRDEVFSLSKKLRSQINDFNELEKLKILKDRELDESTKCVQEDSEILREFVSKLKESTAADTEDLRLSVNNLQKDIVSSYRKTLSDNAKLKEEILSLPSEAEEVKKELLEKVASSAIDNSGLLKEIAVVKKKSFIQEKMNEYFHTQIDRLKNVSN